MSDVVEVADLRRRLAEAEETLRAIREGEVDAVVVRAAEQDQVFHIGGGGESYRAFMEAMDIGAAAFDGDRRLLYANAALVELLGAGAEEALQREGLAAVVGPTAAARLEGLSSAARNGRQSAQVVIPGAAGKRHVVVTAAPLPLNFSEGLALTFTDITERVEAAAAEEGERIGSAIMASANEAVLVCDPAGVVTHANPAVLQILNASPVGRRFEEVIELSFAPGAGAMQVEDLVAIALGGSSLRGIEATVLSEAKVRDLLISAAPLRQAGGTAGGCIITMVDLSERKALEKRQALLMGELDHRMKNMLALVMAISARTLAGAKDLKDFGERFGQRIAALAATQNLLAERTWAGLSIEAIVEAELAPYVAPRGGRVRVEGLAVEISRDAAVALGLVLHELVTNAVKYGALSNETGRVTVTGARREGGALDIVWREQGGPPVSPPTKRGFGQSVIARGLGQAAESNATVDFHAEGVVCRMTLAATSLL